jgi:hypothetical protein
MENLQQYAPVIIVVVAFLIQQRIVVTPDQLERKHREILDETDKKLTEALKTKASNERVDSIASELSEIKGKLNDIYNILIERV